MRCYAFGLLLIAQAAYCGTSTLTLDRNSGPARVGVSGQNGKNYTIESSTSLSTTGWIFECTSPVTNSPLSWFDSSSVSTAAKFYRAKELASAPYEFANDFRLLDQLGRSRWLYYYVGATNVPAVVLIFTGNGCQKIREIAPVIKALTNRFSPQGVEFWLVDSNQQDNRSNILAEATSLGMSNAPSILHDSAQLVARAYHAGATPEAVGVNTADLTIFYHGAIDDRLSSNAVSTTQYYLSNALVNFLAGAPISPSRTRAAGCDISLSPRFTNLTYSADIAPLLLNKCVRCHSEGNIAPWAMTNYLSIVAHAPSIKGEILGGRMPPWKADPYYGSFTNDFSLSTDQTRKLVQWIDDGAYKAPAEPDPLKTAPAQTNYPVVWPTALGQPDAILRIPLQTITNLSGPVDYRYLNVTNTVFTSNVWLRAAIVKPTNRQIVHHCLVFDGTSAFMGLDGFFSGYVPGFDAATFPDGTGKYLTNGQVLQFQMHYITTGSVQTDQTEIGLYKLPGPPTYPLQTKSAPNISFSIPPNSSAYETTAKYPYNILNPSASPTLTTNILLFELSPHLHLRGGHFRYEVIYPAGHVPATEVLLSVPDYVFHWQAMYRFSQPKYIPKGSRILCTAGWDNTILNGPLMEAYATSGDSRFSPNTTVAFGQQTYEEMFIGYMDYAEVP